MEQIIIIALLLVVFIEVTLLVLKQIASTRRFGKTKPIFIDTSSLIDGRILSIAHAGFFHESELVIPRSVIGELQFLADNADSEKRARARHGLDVVKELQGIDDVRVSIFRDNARAADGVDNQLLALAAKFGGVICTNDYNLNKVAQVEDIRVLNVNELSKNLRIALLPGERVMLHLTQKGQDGSQAVGHLEDGTMVVVEHASQKIGSSVEVEVIRSLQTAAGRMMFAKLVEAIVKSPKKPVERLVQKKQPSGRKSSQRSPQPQETRVDTISSDQPQKPQQASERPEKPKQQRARPQSTQRKPQQARPVRKRPPTSASREDDLIRLLNEQE